jgi:hypothetical protein
MNSQPSHRKNGVRNGFVWIISSHSFRQVVIENYFKKS